MPDERLIFATCPFQGLGSATYNAPDPGALRRGPGDGSAGVTGLARRRAAPDQRSSYLTTWRAVTLELENTACHAGGVSSDLPSCCHGKASWRSLCPRAGLWPSIFRAL